MKNGMKRIREMYEVPAKRGMNVRVYIRTPVNRWLMVHDGRITVSNGQYLWISSIGPFHPTYGMVYLDDDGDILKDCREVCGV